MDSEVVYSIFGVVCFGIIVYITLNAGGKQKVVRSKEDIRAHVVDRYKALLNKSLEGYEENDEERRAKKIMLLRGFSEELHFNVMFDEDEAKGIIKELSKA